MTWRALGLVLVVVIGGMTGGQSQAVTTDLSGTWVLKLRLDRSEFRDRPTARRVQGSVTLAAEPVGNGGRRLNGAAVTHSWTSNRSALASALGKMSARPQSWETLPGTPT